MANILKEFKLSSGYCMPTVGLGTWQTANEEEMEVALKVAIDSGYRHIDTACAYKNETAIGKALQKLMTDGKIKRSDLFIVTKLPPHGHDDVEYFCKKSLSELQLDYIDLYLIHTPMCIKRPQGRPEVFDDFKNGYAMKYSVDHRKLWKDMEALVDSGLARSIGVSNFNSRQIRRIIENCRIKPSVLQVECHIYWPQLELHDFCKTNNILLTAYSPLGSPSLEAYLKKVLNSDVKHPRLLDEPKLHEIGEKHNKNPSQIALRYLVQRGLSIIPKSSNPIRVTENIQIFDFSLTEKEMSELSSLSTKHRFFDFENFEGMREHPEFPFAEPF